MPIVTIYTHPVTESFRAHLCSKATVFAVLAFTLAIVPPFFVAYSSRAFWRKEDTYLETPKVSFSGDILAEVGGDDVDAAGVVLGSSARVFSTFDAFNLLVPDRVVDADLDLDETAKYLDLRLRLFLGPNFRPKSAALLVTFRCQLDAFVRSTFRGLAFARSSTSAASASGMSVDGELRLRRTTPLPNAGFDDAFDLDLVDVNATSPDAFAFETILRNYKDRDARLDFSSDVFWSSSPTPDSSFLLRARFRYPGLTRVAYVPGLAQLLKEAWIQYLAIFVLFAFVVGKIKEFVFLNRLFPTIGGPRKGGGSSGGCCPSYKRL